MEVTRGAFYEHGLPLITAWISRYIRYDMRYEIANPFLNFIGCAVEV